MIFVCEKRKVVYSFPFLVTQKKKKGRRGI